MKKYAPVLLVLLVIAVLLVVFLYYSKNEPTISLTDFKNEFSASNNISLVMDRRNSPSSSAVMQCGVSLAQVIGGMGKDYTFLVSHTFAYENEQCFGKYSNVSIDECESKLSNSIVFYVRYNPAKNSTSFYKSKAVIEGDENFLNECAIARLVSS